MPALATMSTPPPPSFLRRVIREQIEARLGSVVEGLFLFGSRARGDARHDSDWDVLAMLRDDADWQAARETLRRIQGELAETIGENVAILPLRWSDASEHGGLIRNVAREGERL